jgi:cytidyltransferase-like protein
MEKMKNEKIKIGFTAGNFDLLHPGYIITFEEAKKHCDKFIVFLQRDPSLHRKSKYKPVIPLYDRYKALKAIKYIDEVYTYQTEEELIDLIKFWKPDVRILGEDYIGKRCTGEDLPPKIIYTTRSHDWSTTRLKDLITTQTLKQNPLVLEKNNNEKIYDKDI